MLAVLEEAIFRIVEPVGDLQECEKDEAFRGWREAISGPDFGGRDLFFPGPPPI